VNARTGKVSETLILVGLVALSVAWLLMKIETGPTHLRWACFLGWVMAIGGLVLKGTYDRAMIRCDVANLISASGFGLCVLSIVSAELGVMNDELLWKLGCAVLVVGILANIVRSAKAS